ncbi:transglutaminase domain-containing protein [Paenibacillus sp. P96]|uniref:Transglutaminase domain-containing protein n=1 Tax=Paenibacillus zeirhizosphaerae TaxID=2987519 RepID=A0ABT9FUK1_9BACL|nr:transglutaminase domain-containing protein [Paenibacillus sp. P96]MDP4098417.1 transglutaminase domain-containing protein [Paenibacillus sp. P96]
MNNQWLESILRLNGITVALIAIVLISFMQGWWRGASRSAGRLFDLFVDGILAAAAVVSSLGLAAWLSPIVQQRLAVLGEELPQRELSTSEQLWYTVLHVVQIFPLLRFAVLFLVSYLVVRLVLSLLYAVLMGRRRAVSVDPQQGGAGFFSRLAGAVIGAIIGSVRAIMLIALLFIGVSLYPESSFSSYVQASPVYSKGAQTVIAPLTGGLIKDKLPVITQAAEQELTGVLQRRYEIIDRSIPDDIEAAAAQVSSGVSSDEEKARRLYDWVGTRIAYDYDKVEDYEQRGVWHEQTPQNTFDTRKGVCIDYARLYAVMARSQKLEVRVVTGLGYNGQGGYGPHAWNEVYLGEKQKWVPLDPTWAQSGDWFNPPDFAQTHIEDQLI